MWQILYLIVCALVADAALSEAWEGHKDRLPVAGALQFQPQVCQLMDFLTNHTTTDSHLVQRSAKERAFRKGRCYSFSHEKFCTYTNRRFRQREGVSIVTTEERLPELSDLSVFQEDGESINEQPWLRDTKLFKEVQIPGKGIGLVATQPIRAGHQVLSRSPAVMLDGRAIRTAERAGLTYLLQHAATDLPEPHRSEFFKLSKHDHVSNPGEDSYDIFATNAFRTTILDKSWEFHSIFTEISRLNHDCTPNCAYHFDPKTFLHKVVAVTDILPGEELTVAYYDPLQLRSDRQKKLQKEWGFGCTCSRCTAEPHISAESDSRIASIHQLWKELDDYSPGSAASPEKAELLIQLVELEGAMGRMHEAYYRAALEWNGAGEAVKALRYARLCLDRGLKFRGPHRPFISSMQELIRDPGSHWSWRFRARGSNKDPSAGPTA